MVTAVPDPFVPSDVDLRGLEYMPLMGNHLFGSNFNTNASDLEWRVALTLWWVAWNQQPAGSLPDDDAALCKHADLGRDLKTWKKIRKGAMHGFVLCSDGRWYHEFLCKQVMVAWEKRVKERLRKKNWREGRRGQGPDVPGTGDGDKAPMSPSHGGSQLPLVPADGNRRDGTGRDGTPSLRSGKPKAAANQPDIPSVVDNSPPPSSTLSISEKSEERARSIEAVFALMRHHRISCDTDQAEAIVDTPAFTDQLLRKAISELDQSKGVGRYTASLVALKASDLLDPRRSGIEAQFPRWWESEAGTDAIAKHLGMQGNGNEGYPSLRIRIRAALTQRREQETAA